MNRRKFLHCLGKGILLAPLAGVFPAVVFGETAFDLGLQGQDLIQKGEYGKAVEVLTRAVALDPSSEWSYGLLGRAYHGLGKNAEAVEAFRQALRINPEDTYSRWMIDMMTQKPLPRLPKKEKPLSPLEIRAREEEKKVLGRLESQEGLAFRVNRVVIDAGHGGFDSGAVGLSGLKEKDVTLDLANRLHRRLESAGRVKSFLTRTADYYIPLSDRTAIANQYQADLFVSLHINANENRKAHGSETYFCAEKASNAEAARLAEFENSVLKYDEEFKKEEGFFSIEELLFYFEQRMNWKESGRFAETFQAKFKEDLPFRSRGVNSANFFVLRRARMPAILLETGFISNPEDEDKLKKPAFLDKIADAVFRGIS